jgi:hypothetical protein
VIDEPNYLLVIDVDNIWDNDYVFAH